MLPALWLYLDAPFELFLRNFDLQALGATEGEKESGGSLQPAVYDGTDKMLSTSSHARRDFQLDQDKTGPSLSWTPLSAGQAPDL